MKRILLMIMLLTAVLACNAQICYKIEGQGLSKPSYVFGTHHMAPLSVIDSVPGCRKAFNNADLVVGEINLASQNILKLLKLAKYMAAPQDSTLSKLYTPEEFDRIKAVADQYGVTKTATIHALDGMKPMTVNALLTVAIMKQVMPEFKEDQQLDTYFQLQGKQLKKKIFGLETPEFQAKLLYCSTPIAIQASQLLKLVDNPEANIENAKKLNAAYFAQDLDALYNLMVEESADEQAFVEQLVNVRNADWLTKLPEQMQKGSAFIAVGAMHLPGEKGILEGLRRMGYTVTPMK